MKTAQTPEKLNNRKDSILAIINTIKELSDRKNEIQLLKKQQSLFAEKEQQINYLELRVQELTNLIKTQKQKIIQDFLNILPEKELIQQLITTYLEFKKAEKQKLPSLKLKKQNQRIEDELIEKLGEEFVENLQPILKLELEERLKGKTFLIKEQRKLLKMNSGKEEKELVNKHEKTSQEQMEKFQELKIEMAEMKGQLAMIKDRPQQTINVEGGHVLVGNHMGDNTNLSHAIQAQAEQQALQVQPTNQPYGTPGSSKN
ncbi:12905_t:CDS:2 [Entrophospora sp. SA101]|nr:12905_t:CDS:2 [Entrophospora sp. SA101]CAJ0868705.1 1361_t:CDS:2 [Entrophospora sp. SA101]